ncbi:MAG TPA: hypothetical protein PLY11_14080 [Syntrophorhabdus sp.]|nr:hypothetical protein [Syntrophorhabdus sp.]
MSEKGWICLHRKLLGSRVFHNPYLLKIWIWCLLRANHKDEWVAMISGKRSIEVHIHPGQFIFGRDSAAKDLKMTPSGTWKRIKKLEMIGNLNIESNSQYSIISIVNWNSYQEVFEKGNSKGNYRGTGKEQPSNTDNNDNNDNKNTPLGSSEISELKKRYPDQELITRCFSAISSTRKSGRVADSVILGILHQWARFPVDQVITGIRTYLEKGYHHQGKDEKYLLGIIRNSTGRSTPEGTPDVDDFITSEDIKRRLEEI